MTEIELKGIKEKIYYDECVSGLKIYMWQNKKVNTFYGTLSIKYGSVYNKFKINNKVYSTPKGVAHFLEHIKFNENKDTTAHEYFAKMGSDTNAFTTFLYTNYQVFGSVNPKENIVHLVDFVLNPYFNTAMIKRERGIIIEEAKMGEDDPYTSMLFRHLNNLFINSEHKYLITGRPKDVKDITLEDIKLAYNTFYHPQNMFLVVTGNFNPYEISEAIKENLNNRKFNKYLMPERIIEKEKNKVNLEYEEIVANVTTKKIRIGLKISKNKFSNFDDLHIRIFMGIILKANFGNTSDFKDELLHRELINSLNYICEIFDDYVIVIFTVDSEYKEEILKLFNEKLANLEISEKAFKRIVKSNIATIILEYEDVEIINETIQTEILNYGDIIDNYQEIYENLQYSELLEFVSKIDLKNKSILVINPNNVK